MKIATEILTAAQEGDAAAFNEIVLAYRRRVIGTIARIINQPEDAEDLAQDVFLRVYFTIRALREQAAFETWLQRLTLNAAYDYLRGPGRRRQRETRMGDLRSRLWRWQMPAPRAGYMRRTSTEAERGKSSKNFSPLFRKPTGYFSC